MSVGTGLNIVHDQTRTVTSLAPEGDGSLYAAITTPLSGASCKIEFANSGNINRIGYPVIQCEQPGILIAGETSPEGINLVGSGLAIKRSEWEVRNFRVIPGDRSAIPSPENRDCVGLEGESQPIEDIRIKGMTFAYALDGLLDMFSTRIQRVTIEDCIFAEPLDISPYQPHSSGAHSTALLISKGTDVLVQNCLFAHWRYRAPAIRGPSSVAFVNNLMYNVRDAVWQLYGSDASQTGGTILACFIGNHAKMGLNCPWFRTSPVGFFEVAQSNMNIWNQSRVYLDDNITTSAAALVAAQPRYSLANAWPSTTPVVQGFNYPLMSNTNPIDMGSVVPMSVGLVEGYVLENAGPRDAEGNLRDCPLETRIRAETLGGVTGTLKNTVPPAEALYFGFTKTQVSAPAMMV